MKTLLATLTLVITAATTSSAQIYRPSAVGPTAAFGAVAGALIGGHHGNWAEGAVIGAAAGAVVGAIADQTRPVAYATNEIAPVTVVPMAPVVGGGYAPVGTTAYAPQQVVYVSSPAPQVVYVDPYYSPATVLLAAGLGYAYYDAWHHNHGYYYGHGGHGGYSGHGGYHGQGGGHGGGGHGHH